MARIYYRGTAVDTAQVFSGTIDSVDGTPSNNSFVVTVGGDAITQAGTVDVATTAAALVVLLNASTNIKFSSITWANPSGGTITGTADTAGVPHVAALTKTGGGTGTVTDLADTTTSSSPCDASVADNYDGAVLPGASDTMVLANHSINVCWGLSFGTAPQNVEIHRTWKGRLGLLRTGFATTSNGETVDTSKEEYRTRYLTVAGADIDINPEDPTTTDKGSKRIMIDTGATASEITIHETDPTSQDSGFPLVRLLTNHSSTNVYVREAKGGVGIAMDDPSETSTLAQVFVTDTSENTKVMVGEGTTITTWKQLGGKNRLNAAATVVTVRVEGGTLTTEGSFVVTTGTVTGGTVNANHISGTVAFTTLTIVGDDALVDFLGNGEARTVTTLEVKRGEARYDPNVLTVTTPVIGDTTRKPMKITVKDAA